MASTWGGSWGNSWGDSWGAILGVSITPIFTVGDHHQKIGHESRSVIHGESRLAASAHAAIRTGWRTVGTSISRATASSARQQFAILDHYAKAGATGGIARGARSVPASVDDEILAAIIL